MPSVKYRSGSVMIWECFAAARPDQLTVTESNINSTVYHKVVQEIMRPIVKTAKLNPNWTFQHGNKLKYSSKFTKHWPRIKKWKAVVLVKAHMFSLKCCVKLKWSEHTRYPSNISKLREEWGKLLELVDGDKKHLPKKEGRSRVS